MLRNSFETVQDSQHEISGRYFRSCWESWQSVLNAKSLHRDRRFHKDLTRSCVASVISQVIAQEVPGERNFRGSDFLRNEAVLCINLRRLIVPPPVPINQLCHWFICTLPLLQICYSLLSAHAEPVIGCVANVQKACRHRRLSTWTLQWVCRMWHTANKDSRSRSWNINVHTRDLLRHYCSMADFSFSLFIWFVGGRGFVITGSVPPCGV